MRARRIMEGTMDGRAILNVLESQGYLHLEPLGITKALKVQMLNHACMGKHLNLKAA